MTIKYVGTEEELREVVCRMWDTRTRLYGYVRHTVIEHRDGWTDGAHICLMCDTIQAFLEGSEKETLIITMPPRHMKSTVVSNALPAWWLSNHPQGEVIMASYALSLARNNARACRDLFENEWHKRAFPNQTFVVDQADGFQFAGKHNGRPNLIAAGTGGPITGSGADLFIIDDPVKDAMEAESVTYRDRVYEWYKMVVESRLSPGGKKVICMTRWHHEDLVGCILRDDADSCEVLHMPAIDDEGRALWPERYPVPALERKKAVLGSRQFEAQYQGRPTPLEGGLIKSAWLTRGPVLGLDAIRCRYWDKAATHGDGDWTVGVLMSMLDGQYCIEDVVRIQGSPKEVQDTIRRTAEKDGYDVRIRMEQEGPTTLRALTFRSVLTPLRSSRKAVTLFMQSRLTTMTLSPRPSLRSSCRRQTRSPRQDPVRVVRILKITSRDLKRSRRSLRALAEWIRRLQYRQDVRSA